MKSLLLKTLLVVSLITITSVLAFSQDYKDCNPEWKKDVVCDQNDTNLKTQAGGASNEPVKTYCESCGAEMRTHGRVGDNTTAYKKSSGSTESTGSASSPAGQVK